MTNNLSPKYSYLKNKTSILKYFETHCFSISYIPLLFFLYFPFLSLIAFYLHHKKNKKWKGMTGNDANHRFPCSSWKNSRTFLLPTTGVCRAAGGWVMMAARLDNGNPGNCNLQFLPSHCGIYCGRGQRGQE